MRYSPGHDLQMFSSISFQNLLVWEEELPPVCVASLMDVLYLTDRSSSLEFHGYFHLLLFCTSEIIATDFSDVLIILMWPLCSGGFLEINRMTFIGVNNLNSCLDIL